MFSKSLLLNDTLLREALYLNINRCGGCYDGSEITRRVHPDWSTVVNMGMVTTFGRSLVHGEACENGILHGSGYRGHECANGFCRGGCKVDETLEHVLLSCSNYLEEQSRIVQTCDRLGIDIGIKNFFD